MIIFSHGVPAIDASVYVDFRNREKRTALYMKLMSFSV